MQIDIKRKVKAEDSNGIRFDATTLFIASLLSFLIGWMLGIAGGTP